MSLSKQFDGLKISSFCVALALASFGHGAAHAEAKPDISKMPWMNKALSSDERASLVLGQMTLDEKIQMVHGTGWGVLRKGAPIPARSNFRAGFIAGIDPLPTPSPNLPTSPQATPIPPHHS